MSKILIVGFQRSGTTLLRRLIDLHPDVFKIYHEEFLLNKFPDKKSLLNFVEKDNIKKYNWGEKVPYYPSARKYPIIKYCEKWNEYFGEDSRILHIIRHPYDIALSTVKKFKNINNIVQPIELYKKIILSSVNEIGNMKSSFTFKYEDLLLNQEKIIFDIYKHCNLNPNIDFKNRMKKIENKKYQNIDTTRVFAYKNKDIKWEYNFSEIFDELNKIGTVKYLL